MTTDSPFDGSAPCPACPHEVRDLSACVHNFCVSGAYNGRFVDMLASGMRFDKWATGREDIHPAIVDMAAAVRVLMDGNVTNDRVEALRAASAGVRVLSDAHFADPMHSHGRLATHG